MNYLNFNFRTLSVKQIKAYAAFTIMLTFSIEAIATDLEEKDNPKTGMVETYGSSFDDEILVESWMLAPFQGYLEEGKVIETLLPASSGLVLESELALESWMLSPFEVSVDEEYSIETLAASSSDLVFEAELAVESWMAEPFEFSVSEESTVKMPACIPAP